MITTQVAHQSDERSQLTDLVIKAKAGDGRAREQILQDYRPFYLRVASGSCRKYLVLGRDDEASIAMIAFNEAIDSYNVDGGASFLSFAEIVIKRRMVDYFRRQSKKADEIPLSSLETMRTKTVSFKGSNPKRPIQSCRFKKKPRSGGKRSFAWINSLVTTEFVSPIWSRSPQNIKTPGIGLYRWREP